MTVHTPHTARSLLFVPATRADRIGKALASGADIAIIDLEDTVAEVDKDIARGHLGGIAHRAAVRINAVGTPWFDADLAACRAAGVPVVVLPKAGHPAHIDRVRAALPAAAIVALIESAEGFEQVDAIARSGVARLALGGLDLQLDLGIEDDGEPLHYFRARIVLASRLARLPAPIDGVCTALEDPVLLAQELARARRFGFGAKLCIHPRQVAAVNAGFGPTPDQVAWARRVLAAADRGGVARVDGQMVDAPLLARAREVLARSACRI